jgi:hypothetical protein
LFIVIIIIILIFVVVPPIVSPFSGSVWPSATVNCHSISEQNILAPHGHIIQQEWFILPAAAAMLQCGNAGPVDPLISSEQLPKGTRLANLHNYVGVSHFVHFAQCENELNCTKSYCFA